MLEVLQQDPREAAVLDTRMKRLQDAAEKEHAVFPKPQYKSRIQWIEFKRSYAHVVWYSEEITNIVIRYLIWKQTPRMTVE